MAIRTQIRLEQLTGSLNDAVAATPALDADSLQGVQDALASAIKRIHGGTKYHSQNAGVFSQTIVPDSSGGRDLGSTSAEWGHLYIGDDKKIHLGEGQDWSIEYDEDGTDKALIDGADTRLVGNSGAQKLEFRDAAQAVSSPSANDMLVEASADLELQAGTRVIVDSARLELEDDGVVLAFGATGPTTLTHIAANDALRLNDAIKLEFRDATEFVHSDADGFMHMEGATGVNLAVNGGDELAVTATESTFGGNIRIPDNGFVGSATANQAMQIEADGDVKFVKDIVMATDKSSIVNGGVDLVTFNGTEVKISGDLAVMGTTTTIDTTNLLVEDRLVGLNYTSGSISGGAGDVGFVMAQTGGNAPVAKAFYYDTGDSRFKIVETATAASGTNITDGAFQNLQIGDLYLDGLDIYGDGSGKAVVLTTGNSPDVGIQNNLTLGDDKQVRLGASVEGVLFHNAASSKIILSASQSTGFLGGVATGQNFQFEIGGAAEARLSSIALEVKSKIESFASNPLILSSSGGQELKHQSAGDMMFLDVHKPASWSDADGIKLAASAASWTNFEAAYGEVSILDAIISAGGGAGTIQKRTVEVTGSAGFPSGHQVPLNLDLDALATADCDERVDIYVNGQLLVSASEVAGNGDYSLVGPIDASVPALFQFNLSLDDVVTAVVR